MEYPTLRFVFDRKGQATKTKRGLIQIEVYSGRKRKWISTGIKVFAGEWKDQKMVVRRLDADILNNSLTSQLNYLQEWINDLRKKREPFTFEAMVRFIEATDTSENLINYIKRRIDERKDLTLSTKKNHKRLVSALNRYGMLINFTDLTKQNIISFDEWLHTQDYTQTTIYTYHKFMKVYIHDAIIHELIDKDPYASLKIERGKSEGRKYLTEEEIIRIKDATIPVKSLEAVRDMFIFQCFTGLAYADLAKFDFSEVESRNGRYILRDRRQKTDTDFYIVLLPPAVEVLEKYNRRLPIITNQQYNLRLKAVADYAGIDKSITSHMARHSFAVYCLNHDIQIETLAKMMGHTDIKTTQIYAKILDSTVENAFDKLCKNFD